MISAREARESARESAREEFEREKERRLWQQQRPQSRPTDVHVNVALPRMANDDDVLTFFNTFERLLQMHNVDKAEWSMRLFPQITSKAQKALRGLSTEECMDYDKVKRSILSYFKLDANAYLSSFRKKRRTGNETYKMWANRLRDLQTGYFSESGIDTFEKLSDAMLAEQICNGLPEPAKSMFGTKSLERQSNAQRRQTGGF